MTQKIRCAGFGGQGIVLMGRLIAHSGMEEGRHTTFFPQYGAAMRGGTANCSVIVSDGEIASPMVETPDAVLIMNGPSLDKFEPTVKSGGWIFYNTSLISREVERDDVNVVKVPANEIAEDAGTGKAANMVMLGAFAAKLGTVGVETLSKALDKQLHGKSDEIMNVNREALKRGADLVKEPAST
ncbi:MAG: 2-oxoacid:ferredoxin oxidoreductase subunit gamma [Candidatus Eisenbacteria bacterium]|nr:2-oxoacid:ferredoxin oxidoreductase subunit gamma [Candidatus Eisenbacteria bacterium]